MTAGEGHRERLRERFRRGGLEGFHDYEVLELLLTYARPRRDLKPLARALLDQAGGFPEALDLAPEEIRKLPGAGPTVATYLSFVRAVLTRYFERRAIGADYVRSPEEVVRYCRARLSGASHEVFLVLYLTARNRVLRAEVMSEGTIDQAVIHPRRLVEGALRARAAGVVFVHNHPSGDATPSSEDQALTRTLVEAARAVEVVVHDHIVVGRDGHFSFRDHGLLSVR